jgi:hypothetical protein
MDIRATALRTGLALLTAAGTLAVLPGMAGADPVNAKNGQLLSVSCDKLGDFTVAVNGNGKFSPGLLIDSTQVGVPYEVHGTNTFIPPGGPAQTESFDAAHNAPRNGRLDECTFHAEGSGDFGTFIVDGTVKISYTPA